MPIKFADESSDRVPGHSSAVNPYAATSVGTIEPTGNAWPYDLPLAKSRRVRQLANDADRAAMSIIGAVFLGLLSPLVFTIFFTGHLWSYDRMVRQYPDLLHPKHLDEPIAKSFTAARGTFVKWAWGYGTLLALEVVGIVSLFLL